MSCSILVKWGHASGVGLAFLMVLMTEGHAALPGAHDPHWHPAKTRVFIASLCWYKGEEKPDFALDERLDGKMAAFFEDRGVPKQQIAVLLDGEANTENVQNRFTQFMRESKPGELLIFYYGGNGYGGGRFCLFEDALESTWFFDAIEKDFKGARAFLMADCCFSGTIVEEAARRKSPIAYACLSSTFSQQTAWSGWRFCQCLMRGFEGNPVVDLNDDGHVELDELASYATRYMAFVAEGKPMFTTTNGFNPKLRLAKTRGQKRESVGDMVEVKQDDGWSKAEILAVRPRGVRVHFTEDTKTDDDKLVPESAIRPFQFTRFEVGERVRVKSGDKWHPAKVLETYDSLCLCRLQGKSPDDDEWFGPDRMRKVR